MKFEIGEIVELINPRYKPRTKAVVLGLEDYKLFDTVQCVKIMAIGSDKPTYTLSDRIVKL
jgi:hypothetical protein